MTLISGFIRNSGDDPFVGRLRWRLLKAIAANGELRLREADEISITDGNVAIDIEETETAGTGYLFELIEQETQVEFFLLDGTGYSGPTHQHTDSQWYTQSSHTSDSVQLIRQSTQSDVIVFSFEAQVPNLSAVTIEDLADKNVPTGLNQLMDGTLHRLARILTTNIEFSSVLRGGPNWRGDFGILTVYARNDVVSYSDSLWIWVSTTPGSQVTPSGAATQWDLFLPKGDPGGTGGDDTPYSAAGWDGDLNAPSKNAIRDLVEGQLAFTSQTNSLAPIENPNFTGDPRRLIDPPPGDSGKSIPNTAWINSEFARLDTVYNAVPVLPLTDYSNKPASTKFVVDSYQAYAWQMIRTLNGGTIPQSAWTAVTYQVVSYVRSGMPSGNLSTTNGTFTAPVDGIYEFGFFVYLETSVSGTFTFAGRVVNVTQNLIYHSFDGTRTGQVLTDSGRAAFQCLTGNVVRAELFAVGTAATITYAVPTNFISTRFYGRRIA